MSFRFGVTVLGRVMGLEPMVALDRVLHAGPPVLLTIWMAVAFMAFALQYDVTDWPVYLLPVFLAASIWRGVALGQLTQLASRSLAWAPAVLALVCVGYLGLRTSASWAQVDASHDLAAENYGRLVMAAAPARAILFAQRDQAVFTLRYFHYALHEWRDVAVIANDLLPLAGIARTCSTPIQTWRMHPDTATMGPPSWRASAS